jgi:hypothetical protein
VAEGRFVSAVEVSQHAVHINENLQFVPRRLGVDAT